MPPRDKKDEAMEDSPSESDFSSLDSDDDQQQDKSNAAPLEKDSDEEELERLVLGDNAGFRQGLFKNDGLFEGIDDKTAQLEDGDAGGLEDVQDDDLFMFDTAVSGAAGAAAGGSLSKSAKKSAEKAAGEDPPAWEDSDDERLAISLAGVNRLRKLRITEEEDVVNGTEYTRRLRQQYLRLNPQPGWVKSAEGRPSKRRRRSTAASSDSSASSGNEDDSSDVEAQPLEKFLRDVNKLSGRDDAGARSSNRRFRPETIDIQRTRDIADVHNGPVNELSFHPEYPVLLSSSPASILYLHHIAPEAHPTPNPQLTSVQAKQVDVRRAQFMYPHGDKIFFAGRRRYFHQWDLPSGLVQKTSRVQGHKLEHKTMERFRLSPCGRYMGLVASTKKGGGIINVLSTATSQWITAARLTSQHGIADFAWWSTGDGMTILGRDGQVGEYSMESQKFLGIWVDEGCVGGTVIALGGHQGPTEIGEDRWVAVGSSTGITNIYDRHELLVMGERNSTMDNGTKGGEAVGDGVNLKERPTPKRTFEQLITAVTTMAFSPDGQLFAFATIHKKDMIKLVHLPTCTVYRNWPTEQTPLGRITTVAFGRDSDLLAVGNDSGKIRLWQLRS